MIAIAGARPHVQIDHDGLGVGQGRGPEPEPFSGRFDEEQIAIDEHPEVGQRLEVARQGLLNVLGEAGQRRRHGPVVVLGVVERGRRILQRQTQDGQIAVARHQTRTDGAVAIEPACEIVHQGRGICPAIVKRRSVPNRGRAAPMRLNSWNHLLHRVFHQGPLPVRQAEELVRLTVDFFEHVAFARLEIEQSTGRPNTSLDHRDQCIGRRS